MPPSPPRICANCGGRVFPASLGRYCAECRGQLIDWLGKQDKRVHTHIEAYTMPQQPPVGLIDEINDEWIYVDNPRQTMDVQYG